MLIRKLMVAGCRAKLALIIVLSLVTGFVASITLDSFFIIEYAENLFTQESMQDTLWLEYGGKTGQSENGYNSFWLDNIQSLNDIKGVKEIGYQLELFSINDGNRVLAISESLLSRLKIPLATGTWNYSESGNGGYTAVVSCDLAEQYPIGSEIELLMMGSSGESTISITVTVTGVLHSFVGIPNFQIGQFVTYPNLANILLWHNTENTIVISADDIPMTPLLGYNVEAVIAVHMNDNVVQSRNSIHELQERLYEKGYGLSTTGTVLFQRAKEIDTYKAERNRLMICVFMLLTAAGTICYNVAYVYQKQRDLAVLRLLGVTRNRIALNWTFILLCTNLLPVAIGISLGQMALSNGHSIFPHHIQLNLPAILVGCVLSVVVVYGLSYHFLSRNLAECVKEEE